MAHNGIFDYFCGTEPGYSDPVISDRHRRYGSYPKDENTQQRLIDAKEIDYSLIPSSSILR